MSLTSLFNFSYLKENLKRSKAIVLLCIFLIPIINGIVYLMGAVNNTSFMPTIGDLSAILLVSMYVIPVILSITLFGFVYKRKSCDFIAAMPISKRQIFLTNTVGGILVLLLMQFFNFIFLLIISLLFNNIFLDYKMLFDIFLICSVAYIFVFTATNIAVSLSSNRITTVVVTLLVLFLVPFIHTFITSDSFRGNSYDMVYVLCEDEACQPRNFECYDINCEANRKKGVYEVNMNKLDNTTYTLPYEVIKSFLFGVLSSDNGNTSLIKMLVLSILYIIIGLILFKKKKFEVVDTSFKSERMHIFVRSLTTVPIICIYYIIIKNMTIGASDFLTMIFLFILIITYLIIYDLITRKKITNFMKMLASLIVVAIVVVFVGEASWRKEETLNINDIETMTFDNSNLSSNLGYTKDRDLINYTMSIFLDNMIEGEARDNFLVRIKLNSDVYSFNITVNDEQYQYITNKLNSDKDYLSSSKAVKSSDVFAISIGENSLYVGKDSNLYKMIIDKYINSNGILYKEYYPLFDVQLYIYDDYDVSSINFNVFDDKEIVDEVIKLYNMNTKEYLDNVREDDYISSYFIGDLIEKEYFYSSDYSELNKFIVDSIEEAVDVNKDFKYVEFCVNGKWYTFVTNKVLELDDIIERIGDVDENVYID